MGEREGFIVSIGCRKCGKCENVCPNGALYRVNGFVNVDHEKCDLCMKCVKVCPNKALVYME
ncbi:4Fe-4S binding protein [uncultured Methanolobus sp.]|uniref:4Fe-4S binding protein n=1 Tax=uncultured Methanolobus sp. TaxID=218300 RepID=UPI002AAC2DDC|nr:4Fe-4S binding protein [uncultured Methanolobus sp.]